MATFGIAKSTVIAGLSLFLLAGPLAFQQGCRMTNCCCQPEINEELSLEENSCCGCEMWDAAQMPIQLAMAPSVGVPDHVRTEMNVAFNDEISLIRDNDFSYRFIEKHSLSPPLSISFINTPLIC
jgi:hypothetical protein